MDDGRLTDGHGRTVNFKNTIVVMTSNAGVDVIRRESQLGFTTRRDTATTLQQRYEDMKKKVTDEVKKLFRPEFLNRLDDIIVFHELSEEQLEGIVDLMLKDLEKRLSEHKVSIELTEKAKAWLAKEGYDPVFGARPLRRVIERHIENPLSSQLLRGELKEGETVRIDVNKEGNLTFKNKAAAKAAAG
jgi:ATP-dependent Clp protease ATP-binding subunit ClpC